MMWTNRLILRGVLCYITSFPCSVSSSLFHPLSPPITIKLLPLLSRKTRSKSNNQTRTRPWSGRRQHIGAQFKVPRGGSPIADEELDHFEEEREICEYEEDHCGNCYADEGKELSIEEEDFQEEDPIPEDGIEIVQNSSFNSSFTSSTAFSLTFILVHFAVLLTQASKLAFLAGEGASLAGARAMMPRDRYPDIAEEDEPKCRPLLHTFIGSIFNVLGEMYAAASASEDHDNGVLVREEEWGQRKLTKRRKYHYAPQKSRYIHRVKKPRRQEKIWADTNCPRKIVCYGGGMEPISANGYYIVQLAKQYNVNLPSNEPYQLSRKYNSILIGTHTPLHEALRRSNDDARFLICYISRQNGGKNDAISISNLLSTEVVRVANRKPLGKRQTGDSLSYYIWISNNEKDAEVAIKKLKLKLMSKSKSSSRKSSDPLLAIIYPANTFDPSTGKLKVTPRVLAQHHCRPPPSSPETLVAWMDTVRKRHMREFAKLQHDRKELSLLRERTKGYARSIRQDKAREEKEEREMQLKQEEDEKERLHQEQVEKRRIKLVEALPEEPSPGEKGVISLALRFADGKRDQRRFNGEVCTVNTIFNWIDAIHGMEREKIELSTMNGKKKFTYAEEGCREDLSLVEAGFGKMTALRVGEIVEKEMEDNVGEKDEVDED